LNHIASALDLVLPNEYLDAQAPLGAEPLWNGRLLFAGTELGGEQPGYLEGALDAAERAATLALELTPRVTSSRAQFAQAVR
jgi:monoamine oxidase